MAIGVSWFLLTTAGNSIIALLGFHRYKGVSRRSFLFSDDLLRSSYHVPSAHKISICRLPQRQTSSLALNSPQMSFCAQYRPCCFSFWPCWLRATRWRISYSCYSQKHARRRRGPQSGQVRPAGTVFFRKWNFRGTVDNMRGGTRAGDC